MFTDKLGINVAHYAYSVGAILWFVDNSNNLLKRTVDAVVKLDGTNPYTTDRFDVSVFRLSEALPVGITPLKFLPLLWYNFTSATIDSSDYRDNGLPWIYFNRSKRGWTTDVWRRQPQAKPEYPNAFLVAYTTQKMTDRKNWWINGIAGDSGNVGGPIINMHNEQH